MGPRRGRGCRPLAVLSWASEVGSVQMGLGQKGARLHVNGIWGRVQLFPGASSPLVRKVADRAPMRPLPRPVAPWLPSLHGPRARGHTAALPCAWGRRAPWGLL